MLKLPFDKTKFEHDYSIPLYSAKYHVRIVFNTRENAWFLSLYDSNKTAIELGVLLTPKIKLLYATNLGFNLYVILDGEAVLVSATDEELAA